MTTALVISGSCTPSAASPSRSKFTPQDPYEVPGFPRTLTKFAFNVILNAKTKRKALGAIEKRLKEDGLLEVREHARALTNAVADHFRDLGQVWCTGMGMRLQNTDAEICRRVQRQLRKADVPALSVHDSFIVQRPRRSWSTM